VMEDIELQPKPKKRRGKPFPKGVSGNPNGRPKKECCLTSLIKEQADQMVTLKINGKEVTMSYGRAAVYGMFTKAIKGDVSAFKEIIERIDGKVVTLQEHTGKDGGPIQTQELSELSPEERKRRIDELIAKRGE
jgi:hypothetical protein